MLLALVSTRYVKCWSLNLMIGRSLGLDIGEPLTSEKLPPIARTSCLALSHAVCRDERESCFPFED